MNAFLRQNRRTFSQPILHAIGGMCYGVSMGREKFVKRQKELARQKKRVEKAARRQGRKEEKVRSGLGPDGEDPDIAGIQPGPQPKAY